MHIASYAGFLQATGESIPDTEDIGWKMWMIGLHHSTHTRAQNLLNNTIFNSVSYIHQDCHVILDVINNEQKCK